MPSAKGFALRCVLKNYLRDKRSANHASLIEWLNPDYQPPAKGARKVRVACIQYQMRKVKSFADFAGQVTYFVDIASDYRSDFVLLPELFTVQLLSQVDALSPQEGMKKLAAYTPRFIRLMQGLAVKFCMTIIAGSHPVFKGGRLLNIGHVCRPDGSVAEQPKLHITPNERKWWGIRGGDSIAAIQTPKAKIGVLICYDVEFPETVLICDLDLDDLHDSRSEGSVTPRLDRRPDLFEYQLRYASRGGTAGATKKEGALRAAARSRRHTQVR